MIEYALLFALGFLAAVLLGMLLAPIVQRRIVRFAEDRLKATMPLSPQEVRAQKDAARAVYAAENAKIAQALNRERSRTTAIMLAREEAVQASRTLDRENKALKAHIEALDQDAVTLRGTIRERDQHVERLKAALSKVEEDYAAKSEQAGLLSAEIDAVSAELAGLRAETLQRDTDLDVLRDQVLRLKEERRSLREDARQDSARAAAAELKLSELEARNALLDTQIGRISAALADKDALIERRGAEIERLLGRARETASELRDMTRLLREAGITVPERAPPPDRAPATSQMPLSEPAMSPAPPLPVEAATGDSVPSLPDDRVVELPQGASLTPPPVDGTADPLAAFGTIEPFIVVEDTPEAPVLSEEGLRDRAARFVERLMAAGPEEDDALRLELAEIGAGMTALTALREGNSSPIPELLDRLDGERPDQLPTLAARSRALIAAAEERA
ncbi:hypothetical protein ACLE20_08290 [Rhizobium sp. YIM 134829]|uniref:hypothetical protein n=1 Tax=Rhizobium sp. YIM 134829 TaxID=3390453 RepID=UPI00397B186D